MRKVFLGTLLIGLGFLALGILGDLRDAEAKPIVTKVNVKVQPAAKGKVVRGATVPAGTITATATLDNGDVEFVPDGSLILRVFVGLNSAQRTRVMRFSTQPPSDAGAGGTQVLLDGTVLVANGVCLAPLFGTPACTGLTNLATNLLLAPSRIQTLLNAAAMQNVLLAQ